MNVHDRKQKRELSKTTWRKYVDENTGEHTSAGSDCYANCWSMKHETWDSFNRFCVMQQYAWITKIIKYIFK